MSKMVRAAFFIAIAAFSIPARAQEQQDKAQSKLYQEQADLIMAETKAMNDARDLMVLAANYDTTNIRANFDAGLMHLRTIGKDQASRYFLRIYRQKPEYRFDLEYWIGMSFQYGMDFNRSQQFYERYRARLQSKPNYQGRDVVALEEVERRLEEVENGKAFSAIAVTARITLRPHHTLEALLPTADLSDDDRLLAYDTAKSTFVPAEADAPFTAFSGILVKITSSGFTRAYTGEVRSKALRIPLVKGTQLITTGSLTSGEVPTNLSEG
ncbi:MAG TPA: hypothetical protein PKH78_13955, partial [Candidatus Obscuribacter sp.]|nr:hypothetical protein [Candidatus Obscuribacter sp.]